LFRRDMRLIRGAAELIWWNGLGRHVAAPPKSPCRDLSDRRPEQGYSYDGMKSEDSSTDSANRAKRSAA
jgi:hypothetical protein